MPLTVRKNASAPLRMKPSMILPLCRRVLGAGHKPEISQDSNMYTRDDRAATGYREGPYLVGSLSDGAALIAAFGSVVKPDRAKDDQQDRRQQRNTGERSLRRDAQHSVQFR